MTIYRNIVIPERIIIRLKTHKRREVLGICLQVRIQLAQISKASNILKQNKKRRKMIKY